MAGSSHPASLGLRPVASGTTRKVVKRRAKRTLRVAQDRGGQRGNRTPTAKAADLQPTPPPGSVECRFPDKFDRKNVQHKTESVAHLVQEREADPLGPFDAAALYGIVEPDVRELTAKIAKQRPRCPRPCIRRVSGWFGGVRHRWLRCAQLLNAGDTSGERSPSFVVVGGSSAHRWAICRSWPTSTRGVINLIGSSGARFSNQESFSSIRARGRDQFGVVPTRHSFRLDLDNGCGLQASCVRPSL